MHTLSCAQAPCVLLTGGTGLLGRALLPLLQAAQPERRTVVLVRDPRQVCRLEEQGIVPLVGDVTRQRLGLAADTYTELAGSVTDIIHAAADVRFVLPLAASRSVNVAGTQQVLDLARAAPRLRRFVHISTLYVNGFREGVFGEGPIANGHGYINSYQQSKHEAEALVLEAMRDLPAAIYRLSSVVADSPQGRVSQFNYFHHLMRHLPGSPLPAVPGAPDLPIDLIPNDWAAAAVAHLFERRFTPGSIRHLCAGAPASLTLAEAMDRTCRAMERHPSHRPGRPVRMPALVSLDAYRKLLEDTPDPAVRKLGKALAPYVLLMGVRQTFLNPLATADLEGSGVVLPDVRDYVEKIVWYCLDTDWGRKAGVRTRTGAA